VTKRKFYRTVFTVEVLSEEEPETVDLETLAYQIGDGGWSGVVEKGESEKLDGLQTARALEEQGSDPCFFRLDENGNDAN
jgi:hypothetical protein